MSEHYSLGVDRYWATRKLCSCNEKCGDVAETDDDPRAVCKSLPMPPREPLVEIVLVPRG